MRERILIVCVACLCMWRLSWGDSTAATHLAVDFSTYRTGSVKGQKEGAGGRWAGGASWSGTVVPAPGHSEDARALEVYRASGGAAGRGSVALNGVLLLESAGKIYISMDVYAKKDSGTLEMTLSNGSVGGIPNRGFSLFWNTTGKPVSFLSSTKGGVLTRTEGSLVPKAGVWYRFEFEISQGKTHGEGTFSVFASTREGTRTAILSDKLYAFAETVFPTFNVVPNLNGDESNAVMINNIVIQSGLVEFPSTPLSGNNPAIGQLTVSNALPGELSLSAPDGSKGQSKRPLIPITLAAPEVEIQDVRTITQDDAHYLGFPTLALRGNGDLVLAYTGGRDYHVCPFGRIEMMVSQNGGESWSDPKIVLDTDLDDRGASIIETDKGTLLLGYISSTVYQQHLNNPQRLLNRVFGDKLDEHLLRWHQQDQKTTPEQKKQIAGEYGGRMLIRSTDSGKSWSEPMPVPFFSPREPTVLSNGNILYVAGDGTVAGAYLSQDDGLTWEKISTLPTTAGEAHCVEAADGAIIAHVREKEVVSTGGRLQYTTQTKSNDGGRTWSAPLKVADGYPSRLFCLKDGTLLMTYGVRQAPMGIRFRISRDHGESWSEERSITEDASGWDVGYPSTVQLQDGRIVTVWYEVPEGRKNAVIRQARWRLK